MAIIKFAEATFSQNEIYNFSEKSGEFMNRLLKPENLEVEEVKERFTKFAAQLKRVSRKADDFTYFSAVMLHAAEANLINQDTGEPLLDKNGQKITAEWIIGKDGSWKWECSDPNIMPYRNNNRDIFPKSELKKAYKKWIGRPLCKDHQSSSVDGIRGIIVDAYYDDKRERVIGLVALDRINYPELSRKIINGYARDVSMGTAVGRACCSTCGRVASTEHEFCEHMKQRTCYGEINLDLSPIELSLVVTGADPRAKLRSVIASLQRYSDDKQERLESLKRAGCVTPGELLRLEQEMQEIKTSLASLENDKLIKKSIDTTSIEQIRNLSELLKNVTKPELKEKIENLIDQMIDSTGEKPVEIQAPYGTAGNKAMTGGQEQSATQNLGDNQGRTEINNATGFDTRFAQDNLISEQIIKINKKLDAMDTALREINAGVQDQTYKEEKEMSDKLKERAAARRAMFQKEAYLQGGGGLNDPQTYPKDPMAEKVRDTQDKQMVGEFLSENTEGLGGGKEEEALKQKLSRAELEERRMRRQALVSTAEVESFKTKSGKVVTFDPTTNQTKVADAEDEMEMEEVFGKKAYWQGGGGLNEPQTYPKDPMAEKVRDTQDKQMVGEFLNTDPEQLGGGKEELECKKMMLRADQKLRAKFVMAYANNDKTLIDKAKCRWEVYAGDKKVLEATGAEIYEDELEENWETLASREYGLRVIAAIREKGLESVARLLKGDFMTKTAEPVPPMPPTMPAAPVEKTPEVKDAKDPIEEAISQLSESLESAEKFLGDLKDALQEKTGETETSLPSTAEADDTCEKCKCSPCECEEQEKMKEVTAALDDSADELAILAESLESRKRAGKMNADVITAELIELSKEALETNYNLVKEASLLVESAKKKEKAKKEEKAKKGDKAKKEKAKKEEKGSKKEKLEVEEEEEAEEMPKGKKSKAECMFENLLSARASKRRELIRKAAEEEEEEEAEESMDEIKELKEELKKVKEELAQLKEEEKAEISAGNEPADAHPELAEELGLEVEESSADDEISDEELLKLLEEDSEKVEKEASQRKAWREKIALEVGSKYQLRLDPAVTSETDMPLGKSHPVSGIQTPEATVEGIAEAHEKIMQQVEKVPTVREAAQKIVNMIKAGSLTVKDLEDETKIKALALDPAAAKYLKDYFSQGDKDSKAFGVELTKEMSKKKAAQDTETQKLRMKRAFDLALTMQERGMINDDRQTLDKQVDDLMKLDDSSFDSLKNTVARAKKLSKTASPALEVGVSENSQLSEDSRPVNLTDELSKMWK